MKQAILFGNGEYKDSEFYKDLLKSPYFIVAVDGGLNFLDSIDVKPDLIIGDLDSVEPEIIEKYTGIETLKFPVKKDKTDTEIAIDEVIKRGYDKEILLAGMLGGRIDHMLSNLFLLEKGAKDEIIMNMVSPEESVVCLKGPKEVLFLNPPGTIVSLLPVTQEVEGVSISGFEYPLEDALLNKANPSLGVSNIVIDQMQTISFKKGILLIISNRETQNPQP